MSDNKFQRDNRDRSRVDANDVSEVEYVHRQFPELSHQEVLQAIQTQGPMRVDILNYLRERQRERDPGSSPR